MANEKYLLLLGVLLTHEAHGYDLLAMLEHNPTVPISLKKGNTYQLLAKMEAEGWVRSREETSGHRSRRIYEATQKGKAKFRELLRHSLEKPSNDEAASAVALNFIDHIPVNEVIELLGRRLEHIDRRCEELNDLPKQARDTHPGVELLYQYRVQERQLLRELMRQAMNSV
ncbi:MAG: PadR family transcriptional regulator [Gammaproteobacteria bacterium]|nr:PadR family transcriptional regulator [Gammaproteobacteria bacterium]